ncbi:MAG: methyltransferase domain-containing protein [Acidimicrobiia bacterium]|nr:methyltransferase domain-containing protein [Acidimicrobiia bacterium]
MSDQPGLDDAYSLDGPDEVRALYRRWADSFETSFISAMGYVYHRNLVEIFVEQAGDRVLTDEAVLDVGCGTGVGGVELRSRGAWPIDGLDLSPEMLAKAGEKRHDGRPLYRHLMEADVLQPLDIGDNVYGGLISIGTFTHGHVGPEAIDELVRVVRPGGLICLGVNEEFFGRAGFGPYLEALREEGRILESTMIRVPVYDAEPGSNAHAADTALVTSLVPLG